MDKEYAHMKALAVMNGERNFSYRIEVTAGGRTFDLPWEAGLSVLVEELDDEGTVTSKETVKVLPQELEDFRAGWYCQHCGWRHYEPCDPPQALEGFMCVGCRVEAARWNPDLAAWCRSKGYHYEGEVIP